MERNLPFLDICDDLNIAKLSLNEGNSFESTKKQDTGCLFSDEKPTNIDINSINWLEESARRESFSSFNFPSSQGISNLTFNHKNSIGETKNKILLNKNSHNSLYVTDLSNPNKRIINSANLSHQSSPLKLCKSNSNNFNIPNFNKFSNISSYHEYEPRSHLNKNFQMNCLKSGLMGPPNTLTLNNNVYKNSFTTDFLNNLEQNESTPMFKHVNEDRMLVENIFYIIKDQHGCRILQKKIEEKNFDLIYKFYNQIKNNLVEFINDQFANYVIQKMIEVLYPQDMSFLIKIIESVKNHLFNISINIYGTRVFQKILDLMIFTNMNIENTSLLNIFKEMIQEMIFKLIVDNNGNHVFQKILTIYPKTLNNFIYEELLKYGLEISKLKQGGNVIQKALELGNNEQKLLLSLEIFNHLASLINHDYGNFIIQSINNLKLPECNKLFLEYIKKDIITISTQKFSSNVIDKSLLLEDSSSVSLRNGIISILIETKAIPDLICNQYGNYVVQKALMVSNGFSFMEIIQMVKSSVKTLKQTSYGKKIYENLIANYGQYFQDQLKNKKNTSFNKNSYCSSNKQSSWKINKSINNQK